MFACQLDFDRNTPISENDDVGITSTTEMLLPITYTIRLDKASVVAPVMPTATSPVMPISSPIPTQSSTLNSISQAITTTEPQRIVDSDDLAVAMQAWHNGRFDEAESNFKSIIKNKNSSSDDKKRALYWQGRTELALAKYRAASETFTTFLTDYPHDELNRSAQFNQALAFERIGESDSAVQSYQKSILADDPIAVYIYERIADLAMRNENFDEAQTYYQHALEETTETKYHVYFHEQIAKTLLEQNQFDEAIAQYTAILNVAQFSAYRAEIMHLRGEAYLYSDNMPAAQAEFQATLDQYPRTYHAYLTLLDMLEADMPVDDFLRGYVDYHGGGAYQPAITALDRHLTTSSSERDDEAHWLLAWSWRKMDDLERTIAEFDTIIAEYPHSQFWHQAHFHKARAIGWQGKIDEAIKTHQAFAETYPQSPLAGESLWKAGQLAFFNDRFSNAYDYWQDMAKRYPHDEYADDALFWAGIAAYRNDAYQNAEHAWQILVSDYPTDEFSQAAYFWQGKALLAMGQQEQGKTIFHQLSDQSLSYYTVRARIILQNNENVEPIKINISPPTHAEKSEAETWLRQWLKECKGFSFCMNDNDNTGATTLVLSSIQNDPAFIRGEALLSLGLQSEAADEFEIVKANWYDEPLAMYQLALVFRERKLYRLSILCANRVAKLASQTYSSDTPKFIRRLMYPVYYSDLVIPQAEKRNLDPALIFALILQESLYDATAQSHANARGLMQIIPPTGIEIANDLGEANYTHDYLSLPHHNIEFGTWYLRKIMTMLDENQTASLAGYNAGPGRVQGWLQVSDDMDVFYVMVPFSESRTYIRRISTHLAAYREIYGEK